jgi:DNA-binding MarR family transcriptional regulator
MVTLVTAPHRKTAEVPIAATEPARRGWPQEPLDDESPAHEAWRHFFLLLQALKEKTFPAIAGEFDLSPVQLRVLLELDPETPIAMSALAHALSCDASNVTGLVDRLEARGLIERRSDGHDRRVKILAVTAAGAALRNKAVRRMAKPPESFAALGPKDQRELARVLRLAVDGTSRSETGAGSLGRAEARKARVAGEPQRENRRGR